MQQLPEFTLSSRNRLRLRIAVWTLIGIVLTLGCAFLLQVEKNTDEIANLKFEAEVDATSVSEIGYIMEKREEIEYDKRIRRIRWWVKVPQTNSIYSCSWESGFNDFREHDGVRIIHKRGDEDESDWSGYIVGLHGKSKGLVAAVWALDMEDIYSVLDP